MNPAPRCPGLCQYSLIPVKKQSPLSISDGLSLQATCKRERGLKSGKLFSASKATWDLWGEHPNSLVAVLEMKAWKETFNKIYRSPVRLGKESSSSHSCDRSYLKCYFPLPKYEVQLRKSVWYKNMMYVRCYSRAKHQSNQTGSGLIPQHFLLSK